jgi:hypothetical protein
MNDKELLGLAARAAGLAVTPHNNFKSCPELMFTYSGKNWNPLTDDGEALRLAVKLGLGLTFDRYSNSKRNTPEAEWFTDIDFCNGMPPSASTIKEEKHGNDALAATRRAIVKAAAELGKAKP